jgi:hypothetical protein
MKISLRSLLCGFVALLTGGCGSSGDKVSEKEFSQVVDRVQYVLKEIDLTATVNGSGAEELKKIIRYDNNSSKDQILRLIEGPSFILMVNGQKAQVKISSAGNIEHVQTIEESAPGCSLTGKSHVSGGASSLKLEIEWEFDLALEGSGCDSVMSQKFFEFQDRETEAFHLQSVKDILTATDIKRESQRQIQLRLKVKGDTN